jgi:hypothetical protein
LGTFNFTMPQADDVNANWDQVASPGGVTTGEWHHLVATYDGGTMELWLDGASVGTVAHTGDYVQPGPFTIGRDFYGSPNAYWYGRIANVEVYNTALGAGDVDTLYQNPYQNPFLSANSLVGSWMLDDSFVSTVADSSGHGQNGGPYGGGIGFGPDHGGSAVFDGTDGQITTAGPILNTAQSFSVTAWAKLSDTGSYQTLVSQTGNQASGFFLQYSADDNAWSFSRCATDVANCNSIHVHATTPPQVGVWTHLAITFNAANHQMILYVNGQVAATGTDPTPYNATGEFTIGHGWFNGAAANSFKGSVSDVQAFQRVLSAADVAQIAATGP